MHKRVSKRETDAIPTQNKTESRSIHANGVRERRLENRRKGNEGKECEKEAKEEQEGGEKRKASPGGGGRQAIRGKVFIEPSIYSQTCPHY